MHTQDHLSALLDRPADDDALLGAAEDEFGAEPDAAEERMILDGVRGQIGQLLPGILTVRSLGTRLSALEREQSGPGRRMLGEIRAALLDTESQEYVEGLPPEEAIALRQEAITAGTPDAAAYLAAQAAPMLAA